MPCALGAQVPRNFLHLFEIWKPLVGVIRALVHAEGDTQRRIAVITNRDPFALGISLHNAGVGAGIASRFSSHRRAAIYLAVVHASFAKWISRSPRCGQQAAVIGWVMDGTCTRIFRQVGRMS